MRSILLPTSLVALLLSPATAQRTPPTQDALRERLEQKLSSPWLKEYPWHLDFTKAKAQATATGRPIFGYFTRSYSGCVPCLVVENGSFSAPEFKDFAKDVVLFAHVTSQVDGRPDDDLLARLGRNVHPTLVFLNGEGKDIGEHTAMNARNVRSFRATLADVLVVLGAVRDPVGQDAVRAAGLLVAEIELGKVSHAAAVERMERLEDLPLPLREHLQGLLVRLEFDQTYATMRRQRSKPEEMRTYILSVLEKGKVPTGRSANGFWMQGAMAIALATKDKALAERALAELKKDPWFENQPHDFLGEFEKRVKALEDPKTDL